jgi:ABC-type nitrate/sulfonate/bicarbonate transport system permease component
VRFPGRRGAELRVLLEMSALFRVSMRWRLRHVVLPAVAPPVLASVAVTLSQALRLAMMAELLAAPDGAGAGVAAARSYLDTPTVLAWALIAVFALVVDGLVLGPVRRRALASPVATS